MPKEQDKLNEEDKQSIYIVDEAEIPQELNQVMDDIIAKEVEKPDSFQLGDIVEPEESEQEEEIKDDVEPEPEGDKAQETPEGEPGAKSEDIDPRLVRAARMRGWSDDKIQVLHETAPEVLEDIANLVETVRESTLPRERPQATEPDLGTPKSKDTAELPHVSLDDEALTKLSEEFGPDVVRSVIQPLSETLNKTVDSLNEMKSTLGQQEQVKAKENSQNRFQTANEIFDEASETFPELGKTEELPTTLEGTIDIRSKQVQARKSIVNIASAFEANGMTFQNAMKEALVWYQGRVGEKPLRRKISSDLNKRKQKFMPRPTHKRTKRSFGSKEEEAEAFMTDVYEKVNISL